jgi:HEAT repeat protein
MLEVSDVGDSAIILLNPQVVTPEGEWEAWFFANWIPGAYRYRSFWELMQGQYEQVLHMLREQRGEPTPYADPSLGVAATDGEGLVAALGRTDWHDRFNAIEALGNLRERRAVEPLLAIFQNTDEDLILRERAAVALGRIRDERALAPLIDALRVNPVSMGDLKVASLFGNPASLSCGPSTNDALGELTVREFLRQMPQALGDMVPPALLEQMMASLTPERVGAGIGDHLGHAVGQALIAFGAEALPTLTMALADPDPQLRRRVADIIGHIRNYA